MPNPETTAESTVRCPTCLGRIDLDHCDDCASTGFVPAAQAESSSEYIVALTLAKRTERIYPRLSGYPLDWEAWVHHAREIVDALKAAGRLAKG